MKKIIFYVAVLVCLGSLSYAEKSGVPDHESTNKQIIESSREAKTKAGMVNLDLLGQVLSARLSADVVVQSLNANLGQSLLNSYHNQIYKYYTLKLVINNIHKVSCDFTLIEESAEIMIIECQSKTAAVDHGGFILYSELNLGTKPLGTKPIFTNKKAEN